MGTVPQAEVDLARIDVLANRLDDARKRVQSVLENDPNNFEALCVYAVIEADLQDYQVATKLYQRALKIEDSPTVRLALSKLPSQ
jgi:Tfp pilus assembly protein PilF